MVGEAVAGVADCAAGVATRETGETEKVGWLCAAAVVLAVRAWGCGGVGVRAGDIDTLRSRAWPQSTLALKLADCNLALTWTGDVLLHWPAGKWISAAPWPRAGRLEVGVVVAERYETRCAKAVSAVP